MLDIITHTFAQVDLGLLLNVVEEPDSKLGWYALLFATSFVKFFIAAVTALAKPNITFLEFFMTVGGGALLSVVFYTYFGEQVKRWIVKNVIRKSTDKSAADEERSTKNKTIRNIWEKYGLFGVAMLAPFLSPMVCVGVAVSFNEDPKRIILFNSLSIIIWTVIFALLREQLLDFVTELGLGKG